MTEALNLQRRLPVRVEEQRLIQIADDLPGTRIGAVSLGRGQAAENLAKLRPQSTVVSWYIDRYQSELAMEHAQPLPNLTISCAPDWPDRQFDLALVCTSMRGEAELTRDTLQDAYDHLDIGGHLVASVDNSNDRWLHQQLKGFAKSVKVRSFDDATVYFIQKTAPLRKRKDFSCELTFKDHDSIIRLITRPGVFAHRQLDHGARQILNAVELFPSAQVVDIGCGSGAIALALAARDRSVMVHAYDSNSRAVECARRGAVLNGLTNVQAEVNCDGQCGEVDQFDIAVANPPYFADLRIAELFVQSARRSLKPGGRLILVNKQPQWYAEYLADIFEKVEVYRSRSYHIATGTKAP